ncbi:hypothetical protein MVEN_01434900 [Mycena venus]|uniref:Uncharacterized protein n=1 Tax=Mycena venus TaxID=2733690 RepID=A0A8H6XXT6_9AGAR|nr:hypothetical protein MVEN_01434900 [Mycena venus]
MGHPLSQHPASDNLFLDRSGGLLGREIRLRSPLFALNSRRSQLPRISPRPLVYIVMQCKLVLAFVASFLALAVSAAPVPEAGKALHVLPREIEHAPFVGLSEVAREPEPEPETETEEARACRMYACIWCALSKPPTTAYHTIPSPKTRTFVLLVALRPHTRLPPGFSLEPRSCLYR